MSSDLLLGLPAKVQTILDRLTEPRANMLDNLVNLDAAMSSRAPKSATDTLLNRLTATRAGYLDHLETNRAFEPWMSYYSGLGIVNNLREALAIPSMNSTVDVPAGNTYRDLISLTGPGVVYFVAFCSDETGVGTVDWDYDIDGVGPSGSHNLGTTIVDRGVILHGLGSVDNNGWPSVSATPTFFKSSLSLRVRHSAGGARRIRGIFLAYRV